MKIKEDSVFKICNESFNKGYIQGWEDAVKHLNKYFKDISKSLLDGVKSGIKDDFLQEEEK